MNDKLLDMFYSVITSDRMEWNRTWDPVLGAHNIFTKIEYSGSNVYLSFIGKYFATFNQISKAGGNVKRGAKSLPVFYSIFDEEKDPEGHIKKTFKGHRYYLVFDVEKDTTGLEDKIPKAPDSYSVWDYAVLDDYRTREKIGLELGNPAYSSIRDIIMMPSLSSFHSEDEWKAAYAHESIHSTGHETRLRRPLKEHRFGSEGYAQEELIAEIGAVMITGNRISDNSKAYLQHWLLSTAASDDKAKRLEVYRAFVKAKQAVHFINTGKTTKTDSLIEE